MNSHITKMFIQVHQIMFQELITTVHIAITTQLVATITIKGNRTKAM